MHLQNSKIGMSYCLTKKKIKQNIGMLWVAWRLVSTEGKNRNVPLETKIGMFL
jgi:hypothetical protein